MNRNGQEPIHPTVEEVAASNFKLTATRFGLSKREYFAGLAMQGLLANQSMIDDGKDSSFEWIVSKSVILADTLLIQLETKG